MMSELHDNLLETLLQTDPAKFQEVVHQLYRGSHQRTIEELFEPATSTINEDNDRDLREKINRTYLIYLERLERFNPLSLYDSLPNAIKVVCQIDPRVWIALLPIAHGFTRRYLEAFQSKKISALSSVLLWKEIPRLFYRQEKAQIENQFWHWIEHPENLSEHYKTIKKNEALWGGIAESAKGFNYGMDYLRSPLDEEAIETILTRISTSIDSDLLKAIIQEKMIDFIANHLYFDGFWFSLTGPKTMNPQYLASLPLSRPLTHALRQMTADAQEAAVERWNEIDTLIRTISHEVIRFYLNIMQQVPIKYYRLDSMYENEEIKQMYRRLGYKLTRKTIQCDDLDELSALVTREFEHCQITEILYNLNAEDLYVLHLSSILSCIKKRS